MTMASNMKAYLLRFGVTYLIGTIILSAVFVYFYLQHNTGASIAVSMGAALMTVEKFIKDHKRAPNKQEKSILVLVSLILGWLISLVLVLIVAFFSGGLEAVIQLTNIVSEIGAPIILGATIFVSILHLVVLSFSYGSLANKQYEGMKNKGKI